MAERGDRPHGADNGKPAFSLKSIRANIKDSLQALKSKLIDSKVVTLKLFAAIAAIELVLFFGLRMIMPESFARVWVNFILFMTVGEFLGQLIGLREQGNFRPGFADFSKLKVLAAFSLTLVLFGWFWPMTYALWGSFPPLLMGVSDQVTTAPFSVFIIFYVHGLIERYNDPELKSAPPTKDIYHRKTSEMFYALKILFPYWLAVFTVVFSLPISEQAQWTLIGMAEPPSVICAYFFASRKSDPNKISVLNGWAMVLLALTYLWNFFTFTSYVNGYTLAVAAALYLPVLFAGAKDIPKPQPVTGPNPLNALAPGIETLSQI